MNNEPITKKLDIYCDGGARGNPGPGASAFVAVNSFSQIIFKKGHYLGLSTNNQAEYQAVIEALQWLIQKVSTKKVEPLTINFNLDSQLVVNQLKGLFKVKEPILRKNYLIAKELEKKLNLAMNEETLTINYQYIPRSQNFLADALVNQTLDSF